MLIGILIVAILAGAGYLLAQSLGNKDAATQPMPDVVRATVRRREGHARRTSTNSS